MNVRYAGRWAYGLPALLISWAVLTVAFGIRAIRYGDVVALAWIAVAVATSFIFHELAHREVARRLGCAADYVLWPTGIAIALFLALISDGRFVFAAPGAVAFFCMAYSKRKEGLIALAGPLSNIIIGAVTLLLYLMTESPILYIISYINWFVASFNLLPLDPLDGAKIMRFNMTYWLVLFALSAYVTFVVL